MRQLDQTICLLICIPSPDSFLALATSPDKTPDTTDLVYLDGKRNKRIYDELIDLIINSFDENRSNNTTSPSD